MAERVDAHAHVYLSRPASWTGERARRLGPATVEDFLATLDASGVQRAVLVALTPGDPYTRASAARFPHRLRAVDVYARAAGPAQVVASKRAGFAGLRAFSVFGDGVGEGDVRAALRTMADLGMVLWLWPASEEVDRLVPLLAGIPDLAIVLNHFAGCSGVAGPDSVCPDPRLLRLADHPGCRVLLASQFGVSKKPWPYPDLAAPSQDLLARFGAERAMWGSNYPLVLGDEDGYDRSLDLVRQHVPRLSDAELDLLHGGVALRLFDWA